MDRNLSVEVTSEDQKFQMTEAQITELQLQQLAFVGGGIADVVGA